MSYRTIDAQQKVDAVKSYWASEKIARIAKRFGTSRATIYAWIALAEEAMKAAFEQTQPGPRGKTFQEENAALRDELKKVYHGYHQSSHLESASGAGAEAPGVCAACGSAQIRKNGTLSSERQGLRQRYSCRQCSWSVYVMSKKNDRVVTLQLFATQIEVVPAAGIEPLGEAVASPAVENPSSEVPARVQYVTAKTFPTIPSGFLCVLADYAEALGVFQMIEDMIHLPMKEVVYSQSDKIKTLMAMIAFGCEHTSDLNHTLRPYPMLAQRFGMEKFPDQSLINRFLNSFESQVCQLDELFEALLRTFGLWRFQEKFIFDFDNTGLVVYGDHFEFACKGYFAHHPGSKGYQLSVGLTSGYSAHEILSLHLDPGNFPPSGRFWDAIYQAAGIVGFDHIDVVRGDAAQGSGPDIEGLIDLNLGFAIKGYSVLTARKLAREVVHEQWNEVNLNTRVADLGERKIHRCCHPVRIVLVETHNRHHRKDYFHVLTHFDPKVMDAVEVFHFYNGRQTIEALFKSEKHSLHVIPLRTHEFAGNYAYLYLVAIMINLLAGFKHDVFKGTGLENIGLHDLVAKLMKIPAQVQYNNNQLELAFPDQHPLIKQLNQPPRPG